MPRYRKVPAVDSQEQKKVMLQRRHKKNNVLRNPGPLFPIIRSRPPVNLTNTNPKDFLLEICANLRGVCRNVRNFTTEMDNLLNSVENILPVVDTVVAGYARTSLPKQDTKSTAKEEDIPEVESTPQVENTSKTEDTPIVTDTPKANEAKPATGATPPSFPSEEEIKAFLSNPLVISLMQTLTQKLKPQQ